MTGRCTAKHHGPGVRHPDNCTVNIQGLANVSIQSKAAQKVQTAHGRDGGRPSTKAAVFPENHLSLRVTPGYHALPLAEMLPKPPNIGKSWAKQEKRAQSGKHLHFLYARLARVSPSRSLRSHTTPQLHQTKKQQRHIKPHTNQKSNAATVK
jgi:hypothetical protein